MRTAEPSHELQSKSARRLCLSILLLICGVPLVLRGEPVESGTDAYVELFGIDATDQEVWDEDADLDGLSTAEEAELWTDPLVEDTDRDGWGDGVDVAPLSRAYIAWSAPCFTEGDDYSYVGPDWWVASFKEGGVWAADGAGWLAIQSEAGRDAGVYVEVDREILQQDLILQIDAEGSPDASLYVDLYNSKGLCIAEDLFDNLLVDGGMRNGRVCLPLSRLRDAVGISLRCETGRLLIRECLLYLDQDGDGLDDQQETQWLALLSGGTQGGENGSGQLNLPMIEATPDMPGFLQAGAAAVSLPARTNGMSDVEKEGAVIRVDAVRGHDANDGIQEPKATISSAIACASDGDVIEIVAGDYTCEPGLLTLLGKSLTFRPLGYVHID